MLLTQPHLAKFSLVLPHPAPTARGLCVWLLSTPTGDYRDCLHGRGPCGVLPQVSATGDLVTQHYLQASECGGQRPLDHPSQPGQPVAHPRPALFPAWDPYAGGGSNSILRPPPRALDSPPWGDSRWGACRCSCTRPTTTASAPTWCWSWLAAATCWGASMWPPATTAAQGWRRRRPTGYHNSGIVHR